MRWIMFLAFTLVYIATAFATLAAFFVQTGIFATVPPWPPGEEVPNLQLLVSAVLVETVAGYLALARNLFGLKRRIVTTSEHEAGVRKVAGTAFKILSRLQSLTYRYSSDIQGKINELEKSPLVGAVISQFGLGSISERNQKILEICRGLEVAIDNAEIIVSSGDLERLEKVDKQLQSYIPRIENWMSS